MSWLFSKRAARRKVRKFSEDPPDGLFWLLLLIVAIIIKIMR